ncbi:hypothetical protein ACEU6E_10695 (plasmid) [Halorutilales archaeon Cl-col2-1]
MPILKEYADSNEKNGYYVHAHISDRNHPLPLQTPKVTRKIYSELGYEPTKQGPNGGVQVPHDLTWTLYNVGLHWTENSASQGDPSELDSDNLRKAAQPDLTEEDIESILEFGEDYTGQYQSQVRDLLDEFSREGPTETDRYFVTELYEASKSFGYLIRQVLDSDKMDTNAKTREWESRVSEFTSKTGELQLETPVAVSDYREKHGKNEVANVLSNYEAIDVEHLSEEERELLTNHEVISEDSEFYIPVSPETGERLPVSPRTQEDLEDATKLLKEFDLEVPESESTDSEINGDIEDLAKHIALHTSANLEEAEEILESF